MIKRKVRVADYIIDRINKEGVNHIFMVTGRGALFLTDAVAANDNITGVSVHHEQAAAYAAVGYSQYTGKPGACLVSTGCAGTNTISGVLSAWQDENPCFFISGQNKLKETSRYSKIPVRTFGQQEADIIPIVSSITKYAVMITDPKRIVYELEKAIYFMNTGKKGPVWIDVPLDVQNMRIDVEELENFTIPDEIDLKPSIKDIEYLTEALNKANRPVVLIGSGIKSAKAISELEEFINKTKIPVTYTGSAPDVLDYNNTSVIGSVGIMGCTRAGNFAVQNSDLLLVLGNRMTTMITGEDKDKFAREANVIVVDIDEVEHTKGNLNIDYFILSDVKFLLTELSNQEIKPVNKTWIEKCLHWKKIFPKCSEAQKDSERVDLHYLADCLSDKMPEDAVFLSDSGLIELILPTNINFKKNQFCIHPASQGAMGFALPASIGAYYASKRPIITTVGDGSIMMNLQELETISYNNIPAKIFVVNNSAYAVIRHRQEELFRSRTIGTDSTNGVGTPDFKKVAKSFDLQYVKIENSKELCQKTETVINMQGPVLCEIMGLETQEYLSSSYSRNKKGRIVIRPIEDQSPFLDRELFLSEMIIEPIDQ